MLFCIPVPIIIQTRLPLKRKIILCCILGLGVFNVRLAELARLHLRFPLDNSCYFTILCHDELTCVIRQILAAVLNRFYNFTMPNSYVFLYWYVAEVGVAVIVGNLPLCWPLVRLILGRKGDSQSPSYDCMDSSELQGYKRKPRDHGLTWAMMEDEEERLGGGLVHQTETGLTSHEGKGGVLHTETAIDDKRISYDRQHGISSSASSIGRASTLHANGEDLRTVTSVDVSLR